MEIHELAGLFPMLTDQELDALAADIRANGLREDLWTYEGQILDGRNRYAACLRAGVEPRYRAYTGNAPTAFVLSLNLHRRHLTYDQRVGLAVKIEPLIAAEIEEQRRVKISAARRSETLPNSEESQQRPLLASAEAAKQTKVGKTAVNEMKAAAVTDPALIDDLIAGKTTVKETRSERNREKRVERMRPVNDETPAVEDLTQRYSILYVDPPWRYDHAISDSRRIENQYQTMEHEDICALHVGEIATEHAVMFMWATSPKLKSAMEVLDAWGFEYKTCAVWVKDKIGPGYYFRQQHELLLVAVKGEPATPRTEDRLSSVISAPRTEHSAKPHEVYALIERMYPELPKVELFSRVKRDGWSAWGNQSDQ